MASLLGAWEARTKGGGGGGTYAPIVTSGALVAASRRITFGSTARAVKVRAPGGGEELRLTVTDEEARYTVSVGVAADSFTVSVGAFNASAPPAPAPPQPPPPCAAGPMVRGLNPTHGDLRHFRQPDDSADPALCRTACCKATDCDAWVLMANGKGLGAPCAPDKPCCYLKSAAGLSPPAPDPSAIACGSKHGTLPAAASSPLHNLELEFTFDPPHALRGPRGEAVDESGLLKWLPNLHRGTCLDSKQQGTSCWVGNDTTTLTAEHFFRSPCVLGAHSGDAFALVPDLELLASQQRAQTGAAGLDFSPDGELLPQALDLHAGVVSSTLS